MKLFSLLLIALLALAGIAQAETYGRKQYLDVTRVLVVDGDTLSYRGKLVRISGLQAPETRGVCAAEKQLGLQARTEARHWVQAARTITARFVVEKNRQSGKIVRARDKYGRSLAVIAVDRADWSETMIAKGLAVAWDGHGSRPSWCH